MLEFWILSSFFLFLLRFVSLCFNPLHATTLQGYLVKASFVISFVVFLRPSWLNSILPPTTSHHNRPVDSPLIAISNPVDVVSIQTTIQVLSYIPSCDAKHVYPFTSLSVLAEQIHFTKRIHNIEVNERQSATFECEVSFDNAIVSWYKDTWELKESSKYNFTSQGRRHFMVIRNVTIEDEGV